LGAASGKAKAEHSTDSWTNLEALPPLPTHISSPGLTSTFIESRTTTTLRERPGFFRRMFGSGKNAPPSASVRGLSDASRHDAPGSLDGERPDVLDYDHLQNPVSRLPKQVQKQPTSPNVSTVKATPPTLTKKSSAFFRRRKKSAPENIPVPLPLNLQDLKANADKPSPISSLRQVMDPYLAEARQSISSVQSNGIIDAPQGYHTALSSPVGPQDPFGKPEGILGAPSDASERRARPSALPSLHIPGSKYNSSLRVPTGDHNLVSFLSDSSSTELSTKSSNTSPKPRVERPKTSPTNAHHSERSSRSRPDMPLSRNSSWKNEDVHAASPVVSTAASVLSGSLFSPATKSGQLSPEQMELGEGLVTSTKVSSPLQAAAVLSPQASGSELSVYRSAPSTPVIVQRDSSHADKLHSPLSQAFNVSAKDHSGSLSEEEKERALMIFENRHDEIEPGTAAAWLGDAGTDRERIRTAYMEVFDWTNLDILTGMRGLCDRLALKGETQQVDRILDSFSKRWCECNPNHGFKSPGKLFLTCD
jgi:Sec7 domain